MIDKNPEDSVQTFNDNSPKKVQKNIQNKLNQKLQERYDS